MTDQELAAGCTRNNPDALRLLYERYRLPLYRMCLRYARDAGEAEDFLHDGMLKVYQRIDRYRGEGALGGWVRRVVLNELLRTLRKRPDIIDPENMKEIAQEPKVGHWEEEINSLDASQIFAVLREIPMGSRTVFNLYYLEGLTHREIAQDLGITEGGSKSQLHKAKQYLRRAIQTHYPHFQYRSS